MIDEAQIEETLKVSFERYICKARPSEVARLVKFMNYSVTENYLRVESSSKTQFLYIHNWRSDLRQVKIRTHLLHL